MLIRHRYLNFSFKYPLDKKRIFIPKRDNLIIPLWYSFVKGAIIIFRLKELREKRKISQMRLAIELNLSQNSISRYESGMREADYKTLLAIADYFNVSLDYLFGRTDNPKINTEMKNGRDNLSYK